MNQLQFDLGDEPISLFDERQIRDVRITDQDIQALRLYCMEFRLRPHLLLKTLRHKKVRPMIRGIHQEYHLHDLLTRFGLELADKSDNDDDDMTLLLHSEEPRMYEANQKPARTESKLAKLWGRKHTATATIIPVKCMRSRTVGQKVAEQRSIELGIPADLILKHGDQYRATDFEGVITLLSNAFDGLKLEDRDYEFFSDLGVQSYYDLDEMPFFALAYKLVSTKENPVCRRRGCTKDCHFVPNYPEIIFPRGSDKPLPPWKKVIKNG